MKMTIKRTLAALFALTLLVSLSLAREAVDPDARGTLTLRYPVSGTVFRLFQVAEMDIVGEFSLTGDFTGYAVSLDQPDQSGWAALAGTLDSYARRDALRPLASSAVRDGAATFADLVPGLYLVTLDRHTDGSTVYIPQPFLISVPGLNTDDSWNYDVTATPKYETEPVPPTPEPSTETLRVHKAWADAAYAGRPASITVQLLRDGKVADTVTLDASNGWSHEWPALDASHTWAVVEQTVPAGYTVSVSRAGVTHLITNTRPPEEPDIPTPPDDDELPKTGMLWWPVPVMAGAGLMLASAGVWMRRRSGSR